MKNIELLFGWALLPFTRTPRIDNRWKNQPLQIANTVHPDTQLSHNKTFARIHRELTHMKFPHIAKAKAKEDDIWKGVRGSVAVGRG
jgi:hypothetical protein